MLVSFSCYFFSFCTKLLLDSAGNHFCYSTDPQSGNTPLHVAASVGYVEAVVLLLQKERRNQQVWYIGKAVCGYNIVENLILF